jgi:uncharacterized protein (TIGR02246 family)
VTRRRSLRFRRGKRTRGPGHDAAAYARLFTPDGDVVNVLGWWWHGRAEIESKLTAAFAFVFKDSTLSITDVKVRSLSPTIAVAYVRWTMTGAALRRGCRSRARGFSSRC